MMAIALMSVIRTTMLDVYDAALVLLALAWRGAR
jgi:hypothetical protein